MDTMLMRRPRYLALALLMIVALGVSTLTTIGRQEDPTITNLFATIVTPFPGAGPERVEALVTERIEAELREIPEIDHIASTSRTGISVIQVELAETTPPDSIERIWSETRDALSDAARDLPPGVPEPEFDADRVGAYSLIVTLGPAAGRTLPAGIAGRLAEALQDRLRQMPGTRQVDLFGQRDEEVRITPDAATLAAMGLTLERVAQAVADADAKVPAGRVRGAESDFVAEVAGEIDGLDRVRAIPVATGPDGQIARVGDIARVTRTVREPPETLAFAKDRPRVIVAARIEDDRQVDVWAAAMRDEVAAFARTLPQGVALETVFDQSDYTIERLGEVAGNLGLGMALVVAVLVLTMGWRAALVVATILPLTSLLSLVVLERLGVTIHQMSVTGLIVALGLLVDAAIVTVDEIRRRLAEGATRLDAAGGAVRRLVIPLAASTLTTVLAFVPMAALPGPAGDFVGAIALSVIVMLFASLLLALTVTPALAGRLLPEAGAERPGWWNSGLSSGWVGRRLARAMRLALEWPRLAMAAAAMPAVVGFLAFPTLTAAFFPGVDRDQFYVQVEMAPGTAQDATRRAAEAAERVLHRDPAVTASQWVVGGDAPSFYYNMLLNRDGDTGFAEALVSTRSAEATVEVIPRLQAALDIALPGARVLVRGLTQGPPVVAPIELRIVGEGLDTLRHLGAEARARMERLADVTHSRADLTGGAPKLVFRLDEDSVRAAGLDLRAVARQLQHYTEGAVGGSLIEGPQELPVRVRLGDDSRDATERLAALTVQPPDAPARAASGRFPGIPLTALGSFSVEPAVSAIARRDGRRINTVQAYVRHGVLPEEVLADLRRLLEAEPLALPEGYRIEWGGETDARSETINNLLSVVGLVVAASVATIVLTFNSWRLSAVAGLVSLLSVGLSLLALELFRYPFGIQALIGMIGAIGVSINAAIILLTAMQEDDGAVAGRPEAIHGVVMRSSRHIMSTTVTTVGGFLPLLLAGGGFWPPFAMAIAGGVALSTIVSFFFVPAAFRLLSQGRTRLPGAAGATRGPAPQPVRLLLRHRSGAANLHAGPLETAAE